MKKWIYIIIVVSIMFLIFPSVAQAHRVDRSVCKGKSKCLYWRMKHLGYHYRNAQKPSRKRSRYIICYRWRAYGWHGCKGAMIVAWGESSLQYWKTNGQYCSLMMMGTAERKRWRANPCLHGGNNVRGAADYFAYAKRIGWGGGWGPWTCKPTLWTRECNKPPRWVLTL